MLKWLKRFFKEDNKKEEPKQEKFVGVLPVWQNGSPQYNNWNIDTAIREGYSLHFLVYRIINSRINAMASVDWVLKNEKGEIIDKNNQVIDLINRPNKRMTKRMFFEHVEGFLCLAGDMFFQIIKEGGKIELLPLHPSAMKIIPKDGKTYYVYDWNGVREAYPEDEILRFSNFNPVLGDFFGLSILKPTGRLIDTENEAEDWNKSSLQNRAIPSGVLKTEQMLTDDTYTRLREMIDERFSGKTNARKPLLLEGGLSWQQLSLSPSEMDFNKSVDRLLKQISIGLGMSPEYLGLVEAKYENKRQALLQFWADTIIPELIKVRDTINLKFENELKGYKIDFDLNKTIYMRELRQALSEEAKRYFEMGVPFNEINKVLGLGFPKIDGGDVGVFEKQNNSIRIKARGLNLKDEKQKEDFFIKFDNGRREWEKKTAKIVRQRLEKEARDIIAYINKNRLDIGEFLAGQKEDWKETISAIWFAVAEDYAKRFLSELKYIPGYEKKAEDFSIFDEAIKEFIFTIAEDRAEKILETTDKELTKILAEGITEGWAIKEIAKAIGEKYKDMSETRALTIARTETIGASNYGHRVGAIKSGVVQKKEWVASLDERTRSSHAQLNGEVRGLHEPYSNGLMYPGDPEGQAGEIINCRCVEVYITE